MTAKQLIKYLKTLPPDTQIEVMRKTTWYGEPSTSFDPVDVAWCEEGVYDSGINYVKLNSQG